MIPTPHFLGNYLIQHTISCMEAFFLLIKLRDYFTGEKLRLLNNINRVISGNNST